MGGASRIKSPSLFHAYPLPSNTSRKGDVARGVLATRKSSLLSAASEFGLQENGNTFIPPAAVSSLSRHPQLLTPNPHVY